MKRMGIPFYAIIFCLLTVGVGCGARPIEDTPPSALVSLSITPVNPSIAPGTSIQFTATGKYSDNTTRNITSSVSWTTSNNAIATVGNVGGSKGLALAAQSTGSSAVITAVSGGASGTASLTVLPLAAMAISPASPPSIAPGTKLQLAVTGVLEDNTEQILTSWATWSSSNSGIAAVGNTGAFKGQVTAVSAGSASIAAGYAGISTAVTLTASPVASILVSPSIVNIPKGTTQQFTAAGTLADSTLQNLTSSATWTSSTSTVATISNEPGSRGLAAAAGVGVADISAQFSGINSTTATLTVTSALLSSISLTPASAGLPVGKSRQLIAIANYTDGSTVDITSSAVWSSSNSSVAAVSNTSVSKGIITAVAAGSSVINASSGGVTSSGITVTVTPVELESIVIAPSSATIKTGGATLQYTAIGIYTNGATQDLTSAAMWSSSNETVAFISDTGGSKGLARSYSVGSTTISANLSGITSNRASLIVTAY